MAEITPAEWIAAKYVSVDDDLYRRRKCADAIQALIEADRNEVSAATEARVREEMAGRLGPFKEKLNLYFAAVGEYGTAYRDMVKAELAALEGKVVEG